MDKILTQEEIDALLSNVSRPDEMDMNLLEGANRFHVYDFKHPDRISKEQIRSLRTIHENFARLSATYLSTFLRTMVDVNLLSIDQVTYSEYTLSLSVPSSIYVLQADGLSGKIILEISPILLLFMVDRLLGGPGETQLEPREITLIEQNVVKSIINRLIEMLNEVWGQVVDFRGSLHSFETDPQFVQIARSSETIVIIFFEVKVKGFVYTMNVGIPYFSLEPILPKLSNQAVIGTTRRKGDEDRTMLRHTLQATRVPVVAQLAKARLTVREFLNFRRDDVIQLPQRVDAELPLLVGGKVKFVAVPGNAGRKKAVRILRVVSPLEEIFHQ
ncbi:MAG: flagellar motor switch protein FliM [Candidatus Zixiibacteriota bacterium]|nr:MAG: flagellar motor switch protein FliM [candidate division Zixibacteria bacterium]